MGVGQFFLQFFFSCLKALHEFYLTSLQYVSLLVLQYTVLFLPQKLCRSLIRTGLTHPPPSPQDKMVRPLVLEVSVTLTNSSKGIGIIHS